MTMRPFTDARGGLNHLVDAQIGRAFPVVHKVYQHLDAIEYVAKVYEDGRARDIVLRTNHTKEWIEWQYKGEAKWTILFKFSDLLGADIADVVAAEQAIAAELAQLRQQLAADVETVTEARTAAAEARLGAEAARDAASESQAAAAQSVVTATQLTQNLGDATAAAEASAVAAQADREAAQAAQAVVVNSAQEANTAAVAANAARDSAQGFAAETSAAKDATSLLQAAAEQSALAAAQSQTAAGDFADAASASATAAALSESTAASHLADLTNAAATTEAAAAASAQHLSAIESQVVVAGLLKEQTETASQAAVDAQAAAEVAANAAEQSATAAANSSAQALTRANAAGASATLAEQSSQTAQAFKAAAEASAGAAADSAAAASLSEGFSIQAGESASDAAASALLAQNANAAAQAETAIVQAALNQKQDTLVSGESIKRLNGESLLGSGDVTISKSSLGLGNVDNTADLDKPVSTAQREALDRKQDALVSGENIKTINGMSILGGGDIVITNGDELAVPRLNSLLVYYGYPIAYKGIWNADAIVAEISASHDYWVVGHTYQDPAHEEYASTVAIMRGVRAAGVKLYGYIPLGTNSYNYTVAQIEAITDQWMAIGVDGIFIDEYGFDYGNTRQRQVDVVNMIHTKGLPICANAWVMEEFVTDSLAETGWPSGDWRYVSWQERNPTNIPSPAQPGDSYLFENFCYDHLGPTTVWGTQERAERARDLALQNDVSVWGMAVFAETTPGTLDTAKLGNLATLPAAGEYISANAYLYDINVVGSGGFSFGSNGTPLWAPLRQLPEGAQLPASPAENNYTDKTGTRYFGPVKLTVTNTDTTQGVEVVSAIPSPLGDVPKAPLVHTHAIADVTGLQAALDGKEPTIAAGTATQYWRGDKTWSDFFTDVRAATLAGLSTATNAVVAVTDTVLAAIGKLQAQMSTKFDKTGGDVDGDINITGAGRRITGDFSSTTLVSRVMFQTTTPNSMTSIGVLPNGSGIGGNISAFSGPNPANSAIAMLLSNGSEASLRSLATGSSTFLPLTFYTGGVERLRIDPNTGNVLATRGALGYGVGAGGTVVQDTSKSTAVALNKICGQITTHNGDLASYATVRFGVSNAFVGPNDEVSVWLVNPVNPSVYDVSVDGIGQEVFMIRLRNNSANSYSNSVVIGFAVRKGATS